MQKLVVVSQTLSIVMSLVMMIPSFACRAITLALAKVRDVDSGPVSAEFVDGELTYQNLRNSYWSIEIREDGEENKRVEMCP